MERLCRLLDSALRDAAGLLPSARRDWAVAVRTEAGQVPVGWSRLHWLAGGLWLVIREAHVARKIVYWLGIGAVAAVAAWGIWLSWRNLPANDPEVGADRIRIMVGSAALLGLPWVVRRRGWFGPVGDSVAARLARLAGCAAICGIGIALVKADRSAGPGGGIGSGEVNWLREIGGLGLLVLLVVVPLVIRAKRPGVEASTLWGLIGVASVVVWILLPLQLLALVYVAMILLATSRRFALSSAMLLTGAIAGVAAGLIDYAITIIPGDIGFLYFGIIPIVTILAAAPAGAVCGWLLPGTEKTAELREARIRQGLLAGTVVGVWCGLLLTNANLFFVFVMILGPVAGLVGGALGGAFAADHPLKWPREGSRVIGIFASGS